MYECFHCGERSVIWQCDYMFEDFGYEGEGIVQVCHCTNCGADIEYRIPIKIDLDEDGESDTSGSEQDDRQITFKDMGETYGR